MHFAYHDPPAQLAAYVKTIWMARGSKEEFDSPEPIVPDGCVEIIFNCGDPFKNGQLQPLNLLAGQMTRPVIAVATGAVDLIGIRFWPGRAGAALRTPMWELRDQLIDASGVLSGMDRLLDELRNTPREERFNHVTAAMARRLGDRGRSDSTIDHALAFIESRRGNITIDRLARHLGITRRHLERRFRDEVGLGAKYMARISRVHAVLHALQQRPLLSGAEIAADCGYSDQAHLIREFRALTGTTPARMTSNVHSLASLIRES
jgi:AraC-like DNA-binding protein